MGTEQCEMSACSEPKKEEEEESTRTQTLEIVHIHFVDSRCLDS